MNENVYTTKQARDALGLSAGELRFFLRYGLIPHLKRTRTARIILAEWQLDWIQVLAGLKRAGFTRKELQKYTRLARRGAETLPERKAMIETKRQQAWQDLEEYRQRIDILTRKEEFLEKIITEKPEHQSNWI